MKGTELAEGRGIWVQTAKGAIRVGHGFSLSQDGGAGNGKERGGEWTALAAGDGAALQGERKIGIRAETAAEILVFDLA